VIRQDIWSVARALKEASQSIPVVDKTRAELLSMASRCFLLEKRAALLVVLPAVLTPELQDCYLGI
jgi:hypothetical protein